VTELARIRNFAIVAHINQGNSILAGRIIERCGGLGARTGFQQEAASSIAEGKGEFIYSLRYESRARR
jgi:translation elongation factor EF-4